jgi:hypothetical protein
MFTSVAVLVSFRKPVILNVEVEPPTFEPGVIANGVALVFVPGVNPEKFDVPPPPPEQSHTPLTRSANAPVPPPVHGLVAEASETSTMVPSVCGGIVVRLAKRIGPRVTPLEKVFFPLTVWSFSTVTSVCVPWAEAKTDEPSRSARRTAFIDFMGNFEEKGISGAYLAAFERIERH